MFEKDALKRGIPEPFYHSASAHVQARTRELHSKPSARAQDYTDLVPRTSALSVSGQLEREV